MMMIAAEAAALNPLDYGLLGVAIATLATVVLWFQKRTDRLQETKDAELKSLRQELEAKHAADRDDWQTREADLERKLELLHEARRNDLQAYTAGIIDSRDKMADMAKGMERMLDAMATTQTQPRRTQQLR